MSLSLVTPPAVEPVTLAQQKLHSRIARDDEDSLIEGWIRAARIYAETVQRRQLMTATWRLSLDEFPCWELAVPLPPLQSVTSIAYVDAAGVTQTLDPSKYLVDIYREPGRITPAFGQVWPTPRCQANAVTVTFVAGYGSLPSSIPQTTRQAIMLLAAQYIEHREPLVTGTIVAEVPMAVSALLACEKYGGYP